MRNSLGQQWKRTTTLALKRQLQSVTHFSVNPSWSTILLSCDNGQTASWHVVGNGINHSTRPSSSSSTPSTDSSQPSQFLTDALSNILYKSPWHNERFMDNSSTKEKEKWLRDMQNKSPTSLDTEAYLFVLRALANSDEADAPLRAERWIIELEKVSQTVEQLEPSSKCYQLVVQTWANAKNEDPRVAIPRAERWLTPKASCGVDTDCFNAFLDLCTRGRYGKKASLVVENALKAENVLRYMIEQRTDRGPLCSIAPDADSFNFVLRGWTRCRTLDDIVERTVRVMQVLSQYGRDIDPSVQLNEKSYSMLLDAFNAAAKNKVKRYKYSIDPTKNGMEEIKKMQEIINSMHENPTIHPVRETYNVLLACWANVAVLHDSAPYEAEDVLRKMIQAKKDGNTRMGPDMFSYKNVIRAWCSSKHTQKMDRAIFWLETLWRDSELNDDESLKPNADLYNTLIKGCVEIGDSRKADNLLQEMLSRAEESSNSHLKPNSESFIWVTRGYTEGAKMGKIEALDLAVANLHRMIDYENEIDQDIAIPAFIYEEILKACSRCARTDPNVLNVAVDVFEKLRSSHHSTSCLAYQRLLQTGLMALSRPEDNNTREAFVKELIQECAEAGLVGSPVIRALTNGPVRYSGYTIAESKRLTVECFPEWPLPSSWSRNVNKNQFLPKLQDLKRVSFDKIYPHRF